MIKIFLVTLWLVVFSSLAKSQWNSTYDSVCIVTDKKYHLPKGLFRALVLAEIKGEIPKWHLSFKTFDSIKAFQQEQQLQLNCFFTQIHKIVVKRSKQVLYEVFYLARETKNHFTDSTTCQKDSHRY